MIRLVPDHAARIRRAAEVTFRFDGVTLRGFEGEMLVAALIRTGVLELRRAPQDDAPRGAFCCMGLCQECAVVIAGQTVEACRTALHDGMEVARR